MLPGQSAEGFGEIEVWPLFLGRGEIIATPLGVGEDEVPAALPPGTGEFRVWTVPWSQLAQLALLVAAPTLVVRARRRSAARIQARIDSAVAIGDRRRWRDSRRRGVRRRQMRYFRPARTA